MNTLLTTVLTLGLLNIACQGPESSTETKADVPIDTPADPAAPTTEAVTPAAVQSQFDDRPEYERIDTAGLDGIATLNAASAAPTLTGVSISSAGVISNTDTPSTLGTLTEWPASAGSLPTDVSTLRAVGSGMSQVGNTQVYPYSTVGRFENGCTGTMIGPRHVLTAGHCVFNHKTNKFYSNLAFSPARNGAQEPFGKIAWVKVHTVDGWTKEKDYRADFAMVVLAEPVGDKTGHMGLLAASNDELSRARYALIQYPKDKPARTMWYAACPLVRQEPMAVAHGCDTAEGSSGSALHVQINSLPIVYVVHSHTRGNENIGVRLTNTWVNLLKGWRDEMP